MSKKTKIVIVGAGFGGIEFVKALHNKPVEVLLIDRNNYHNFQPLMYQVATGGLEPSSIAYPVRRIFINFKNFSFRMAEVLQVDIAKKQLLTSIGTLTFDFLVIASGSENNFFNFDPVKEELLPLKSVPDSLKLRNHIFQNFERAMACDEKESVERFMNIAVVGGGPAGLELAGALAEMKRYIIPKEFPGLDLSKMSIHIYESGAELLGNMSAEASAKSLEYLKALGVNVFLKTRVKNYDGSTIELDDGSYFTTDSVIWSAGVKGSPIKGFPETTIVNGNRIAVNEFNQVIDTENIFAIGDVAAYLTADSPKGLPMLAPVAQQQGAFLAENILRKIKNEPMHPFQYRNKGVMATIGRNKAVVDLPHYKFQGIFAWFIWMFVHILSLAGYRNKIITFIDWVINYFSYARPLGVILISTKAKDTKQNSIKTEKEKV